MQKCYLQDHCKAVREADYLARTTNYSYLVEKRLWQKTELYRASSKAPQFSRIHRTTDGPLNITVWPNKTKIVDSEEIENNEAVKDAEVLEQSASAPPRPSRPSMMDYDNSAGRSVRNSIDTLASEASVISMTMSTFRLHNEDNQHILQPSVASTTDADATPASVEEAFFSISPDALRKALQIVLAKEKKQTWMKKVDDDHFWRFRAKWRQDWYPEEKIVVIRSRHL
jgi:hypothetical protein